METIVDGLLIDILDHALAFARTCVALATESLDEIGGGVTVAQFQVLLVLGLYGPHSVIALSRRLDLAPPATSRMLDRLCRQGLVNRTPSPRSGREVDVTLTDAGKQCLRNVMEQRRAHLAEMVREIPRDNWEALRTSFHLLTEASGEPIQLAYALE